MEQSEKLKQTDSIEDLSVQKEIAENVESNENDENNENDDSENEISKNMSIEKNESDQMETETAVKQVQNVVEEDGYGDGGDEEEEEEEVAEQEKVQEPEQEKQNIPEVNKENETIENDTEQDDTQMHDLSAFLQVEMNVESNVNETNEQSNKKAMSQKNEEIPPTVTATAAAAVPPPDTVASNDENIKTEIKNEENPAMTSSENIEKDNDSETSDDDEDDDSPSLQFQVGRTVTLQMLLAAKLLEPGPSAMTIEYLGQKFVGDLLPDGKIKSQETETIFCSPSAWAMHCKRIINPEKKSGCGWASIKVGHKNKKLDAIKASYLRKCQLQKEESDEAEVDLDTKPGLPELEFKRIVLPFNTINNRNIVHDPNTLVESVSFVSQNKLQPFMVSITTSSVLLMDFHCHLTKQEVCGYLGGSWDNNTQTLAITHAFPVRNTRHDRHYAIEIEQQIQRNMLKRNLILVGWYHSHPRIAAHPTLRDCDAQLEYQIKMCGISDETYTPCVGLICAPYYSENPNLESSITAFWVVPPLETRPLEYGRPMSMQFSVSQDIEMSEHIKTEMLLAIDYYRQFDNEMVNFEAKYDDEVTFIEKLKTTLYSKFPREQNDFEFWNWLRQNLGLPPESEFTPPKLLKTINNIEPIVEPMVKNETNNFSDKVIEIDIDRPNVEEINKLPLGTSVRYIEISDSEIVEIKDDDKPETPTSIASSSVADSAEISKEEKLQIRSLQEQLKLPSGLNMNPSPISSIPLLQKPTKGTSSPSTAANTNTNTNTSASVSLVSPRDSPISTPSNSASPATKFDIRPPATPSPAKSDASSRNRNSPLPANLTKYPAYHNTPTSSKTGSIATDPALAATKPMEELFAASFPSGKFPGYSPAEYAALLQQASSKDLTIAANLLAANPTAADKHTSALTAAALDPSTNMKDFLAQLEKSTELSYLLQQQYQYPGLAGMTQMKQGQNSSSSNAASNTSMKSTTKQSKRSSRSSSNSSQQRNFDDDYKNESNKMNEYEEYAKLLLNQAEALNAAVAHQNYGQISSLVSAINTLPTNTSVSAMPSRKSRKTSTATQPIPQQPSLAELSQLLHNPGPSNSKMQELLREMEGSISGMGMGMSMSSKQSQNQKQQQQREQQQQLQREQQQQQKQHQKQQQQQQQQQQHLLSSVQQQMMQSSQKGSSNSSSKSKQQQAQNNALSDYMSLLSQAKLPDLASLMAQSYAGGVSDGNLPSDLSMLLRPQYDQHAMSKNSDLASLNASIDMLGNLFSSGKNNSDINSLLFPQTGGGGKGTPSQADIANFLAAAGGHQPMNPPSTQSYTSKSASVSNPYYTQSAAALDKAQQDLIALNSLYGGNAIASSLVGGGGGAGGSSSSNSGKYPSIPDPLSKSTLAANNMFMNPSSIYAKLQQDALNAMIMKPPSKTSSKSDSKSREQLIPSRQSTPSPSSTKHNFNVADLAVSSVNQTRPPSRSPHKKQFSISDLVSPPSKMMKMMESFGHDPHGDDKAEILNLSGSSSDK